MSVEIAVQASPSDRGSWLQLAREVETGGFAAIYCADHPGTAPSPFVALAAAAAVTDRIELGTCVLNAGMWEPVGLANDVATLDVVSGGRAILGIGAGHTPREWTATGRPYPSAADRVSRMIELTQATRRLLDQGSVDASGHSFTLVDAVLDAPRPVRGHVPLLVGGNGGRVLQFAALNADIVSITGLTRTLADGHRHEVDWSEDAVRHTVEMVLATANEDGRRPRVEALVQVVEITDDMEAVAGRVVRQVPGATADDLIEAPYVWIGSVAEIRDKLRRLEDLGIDRYVIRPSAIAAAHEIISTLG